MYQEDRARERWKTLAARLWKQRNEALRQLKVVKEALEDGFIQGCLEAGRRVADRRPPFGDYVDGETHVAATARLDELDEALAMLVGAWTERANALDASGADAVMVIDTLRACRNELMGRIGLIHDGSKPVGVTPDATADVKAELGIPTNWCDSFATKGDPK